MITVTEPARQKIVELKQSRGLAEALLRVGIRGRGPAGFLYTLAFATPDGEQPDDTRIRLDGITLLVDADSMDYLQGASIDFVDTPDESGFRVDNPNPLWRDPTSLAIQAVIDTKLNPALASHGGFVQLLQVDRGTAYVALGGGCQGCGMVDVTLKQGIGVMIRQEVPSIERVVDTTDHAGGTNPYYRPSKGGQSPLAKG
jgi:Fe/S biogenesis protein NfuA